LLAIQHIKDYYLEYAKISKKYKEQVIYLINDKGTEQTVFRENTNMKFKRQKCSTSLAIGYANENYNEIPFHPTQNGKHQEDKHQEILVCIWGGKEPIYTVGGNAN
jgi:hypothetical protein